MNRLAFLGAIIASTLAFKAAAECTRPEPVPIPDGSVATLEEMLEAQTAVREYIAKMEEFLACINEEIDAQGDETPQEITAAMIDRHNNAVTEMEMMAAQFNEQRVAYQQAHAAGEDQ